MKSKKWLIGLVILLFLIIVGGIYWYFALKTGQVSADSIEKWSLSPDTGISVNITDGIDEVKSGDVLNYQINFAYQGQKVANQTDMDKIIQQMLDKLGLKDKPENTQLVVVGYLTTAKAKVTAETVRNKLLSSNKVGSDAWLLKYPNFQMTVNKLKPNTNGSFTVPSIVEIPDGVSVQGGKVYGNVYVYLTLNETNYTPGVVLDRLLNNTDKNVLVAKATDTDELVTSTTTVQSDTNIVSLEISPQDPVFILGGQQIAFKAVAKYNDGTSKEITGYEKTKWEVTTTKPGKYVQTIGEISPTGIFKPASYSTPGKMNQFKAQDAPKGKVKVTYGNKTVETAEFYVWPSRSIIDSLGF